MNTVIEALRNFDRINTKLLKLSDKQILELICVMNDFDCDMKLEATDYDELKSEVIDKCCFIILHNNMNERYMRKFKSFFESIEE